MSVLAEAATHAPFFQDYLSVQFDPAHLLSELGFELVQAFGIYFVWRKWIKPRFFHRLHDEFDTEHGITPHHGPEIVVFGDEREGKTLLHYTPIGPEQERWNRYYNSND